jgi:hypothetical protein
VCNNCGTLLAVLRVRGEKFPVMGRPMCVRHTVVSSLEAVRSKSQNMSFDPSSLLANPYGIHQVLMSPDPEPGKTCYQNASFAHSPDPGCLPKRLEALASDQDGHAFDRGQSRLVWRLLYFVF